MNHPITTWPIRMLTEALTWVSYGTGLFGSAIRFLFVDSNLTDTESQVWKGPTDIIQTTSPTL